MFGLIISPLILFPLINLSVKILRFPASQVKIFLLLTIFTSINIVCTTVLIWALFSINASELLGIFVIKLPAYIVAYLLLMFLLNLTRAKLLTVFALIIIVDQLAFYSGDLFNPLVWMSSVFGI
ncbi:hypothetical protein A3A49_00730 [Candidatus Curtissbacteria bacterium RIFCSPLOWO2_01_FULL_38_11b]|uniref:Uncharacterized protein n=1 Tax=Candidatus Curtissbacteria bacterium RIFCSPLOWO2_01_FULL_38_11b TaxID=1797725 RepID=A0A1F5H1X8_9BACT|nr:MAG: hypothetical protein A3A49_00730 [Candidatus Curtissbacteria bacterium RIFCSPLOWO2_01_FULL_38_11b]